MFKFILLLLVLSSCDENGVYDNYIHVSDSTWDKDSIISFKINLDDTLAKNNVFLKVRNTVDYEFSNLYLFTVITFPDGRVLRDTLEYEMTSDEGKWLGEGMSGVKSNLLFYKKNVVFYEKGEYILSVQHGMRTDKLEGIKDVGLRIERE
ncbi:MAG: gliding motility lipoprotein GldH [Flavobacteriales bacterium]|nr:gliding motility lipoprotein GldH [Flavobacteriales bacterium]